MICPSNSHEFFNSSNTFKTNLCIENIAIEDSPFFAKPQPVKKDSFLTQHWYDLPPVFSHINLRVIEMLCETQHGEFTISCKKGNYEIIVETSGHVRQRYYLTKTEIEDLQKIYYQYTQVWIAWWSRHNL
ncbi:hypothetical protein CEN44_16350 [Fischerella muscicola CCMEE 5323]|uniref:Uncharacterized protein n=1 Tax=Fischerella muscicola CCMEE 5323 TaxID=2019572 RepID=A0A2N6K0Y0_FISMU|nr:hypothetical protein CEN44_16350 [Fischerella muscicola CCMEE 5323]